MEDQTPAVDTASVAPAESTPAIEPVVSETSTQEETTEAAPQTTDEHTEEVGAEPSRAEKRIKQLVNKQREAEREAAYWRGRAESTPAPVQHVASVVPVELVAPKLENFESYEEFENAKEEYIVTKAEQRILQKQLQQKNVATANAAHEKFLARVEKAAEEDPDIKDYVEDHTLPISSEMASVIRDSDVGPQLLKHLGQNRDEATRLEKLSKTNPVLAIREMGKLEERLSTKPKPVVNRISAAPEPVKTVTATGNNNVDESSLSMEEWARRRNEQQFKRR
jgi:hypothetical protein